MRVRSFIALVTVVAMPFVPVLAQPQSQPTTSTLLTTLRGTIQSIGYRSADRNRQVFVTIRVGSVSGPNPRVDRLVRLPNQPSPASPPTARTDQPAFRTGDVVRFVYACALDASSARACTSARNHPAALGAARPVTLSLIRSDARADELPAPETRAPAHDVPFISTQGPTFRLVENGVVSAILLEVYNGDPGPLTTSPGPMVLR